ncbi:parallel beta-helix repeat-containing protein [Calothrix sp. NIES-4071]|nr:parallel beta-helix repeat-containing protein [Calothrix sp. NIES-4071]BAZ54868.1 parallel beta-helix repeat-containing protein [Calothrix sp. NIES-4105]
MVLNQSTTNSLDIPASSGMTYHVSTNGLDTNLGTAASPWRSINHATSKDSPIQAGDTIEVESGVYTETITLEKSGNSSLGNITLKADGNVTLRDPNPSQGGFREGVIQSAGQGYWTIDGFRIENTSWAGISLRDANNMIVQNNHTYQTGASGIIVLPDTYYDGGEAEVTSSNIKILNNTIERANWNWKTSADLGTQESLSIWGVDGFEVANNIVKQGKTEGIDAKVGSRNGSIHDNTVTAQAIISGTPQGYNGGPAIYLDGNRATMFNISVYNNTIYNNTADAIAIADEVPQQGDVHDIRVFNNVVYGNGIQGINGGSGIAIQSNVHDVEIEHNTFFDNVQAFNIDGLNWGGKKASDITIRNNIFANSTYRNGFIGDTDNVTISQNLFTNGFSELYQKQGALGNLQDSDNIIGNVEFVNASENDFHLLSSSPAIDAGFKGIGAYADKDKDGIIRPQGRGNDIGAFEYR